MSWSSLGSICDDVVDTAHKTLKIHSTMTWLTVPRKMNWAWVTIKAENLVCHNNDSTRKIIRTGLSREQLEFVTF
jgi:hypothetical protein